MEEAVGRLELLRRAVVACSSTRMPCSASAGRTSLLPLARLARAQLARSLGDPLDRLRRRQPVRLAGVDAGVHLVVQARDAHHHELVEIGRVDGEELHPLEQGRLLVLGQLEHPLVEVQPRQLAVGVELGRVEVRATLCGSFHNIRADAITVYFSARDLDVAPRGGRGRLARRGAALTAKGEEQSRAVGAALDGPRSASRVCVTSPKVRARRHRAAGMRAPGARGAEDERLAGGPFDPREVAAGLGERRDAGGPRAGLLAGGAPHDRARRCACRRRASPAWTGASSRCCSGRLSCGDGASD